MTRVEVAVQPLPAGQEQTKAAERQRDAKVQARPSLPWFALRGDLLVEARVDAYTTNS